jgi:hypothetical protein
MTGAIKGVGMLLKSRYPQIVLWHCLNHRLELAVSDTITAVDGTQPIEDFIGKIYTIYSQSEKMQRGLKNIAAELDVQLRKVDKILTTRWVTHTSRGIFLEKLSCIIQAFLHTFTVQGQEQSTKQHMRD